MNVTRKHNENDYNGIIDNRVSYPKLPLEFGDVDRCLEFC